MERTFNVISRLLSGHMLGHAFTLLHPWVADILKNNANLSLNNRLRSLEKNYRYVVDYFMSAEDDPNREEVTENLIREAFILLDDIYLEKRLQESTSYEFRQMLQFIANPVGPRVESEDDIDGPPQVFRFFWLTRRLEDFDLNVLDEYIHNPQMEEEAELGISGLTLNLLRNFSEEGMQFLVMICAGHHAMCIMERAWVSLMLLMLHYDIRMRYFPSVMNAFLDLIATEEGNAFAQNALSALVRTSGIKWVTESYEKMQEQIRQFIGGNIPDKLTKNNILTLSTEDQDDFNTALTDEFKSALKESERKMMEQKAHNLDIDFAMYKGMYTTPFFSDPFHWWLPFDTDYLDEKMLRMAKKLEGILSEDVCDSDCYALIAGLASLEDCFPDGALSGFMQKKQPVLICNEYTRQAFRFFALNPWGIANVFNEVEMLHNSNLLKLLRPAARDKIHVADLFLSCHAYPLALQLYEDNVWIIRESAETWSNYALCLQKTGAYRQAADAYDVSLKHKKSEWAMRQKVWCLMRKELHNYTEALSTIEELLEIKPKDFGYLFTKGKCLEHMELFAEALDVYYELDMLSQGNLQVMRAIAWCAFISGDYEQARGYYQKIMASDNRKMIDVMNYGHFLFVQSERAEAFRHYKLALSMNDTLKAFLEVFRPDRRILLEKGIPTSDIYLMEDQLISTTN